MNTTTLTTVSGCVFACAAAAQTVPGIDSIPYMRLILGIVTAVSGAIMAYFAKGRKDTGQV